MTTPGTATVYDFEPAQLRRAMRRAPAADVLDDLADGIEAVHQLANIARFGERPRAFVFALATAARSRGADLVELYDAELAALQNCSERTVQRQRADYIAEARLHRFELVEFEEGEFDRAAGKNAPTRYRFHLGGYVERIIALARETPGWDGLKRSEQRAAIRKAAEEVFDDIPDARRRGRKRPRPRPAASEVETCFKVMETKAHTMRQRAPVLPAVERERLFEGDDPEGLRARYLQMRAELDALFNVVSPQTLDPAEVDRGTRQVVVPPPAVVTPRPEPAEAVVVEDINNTTTASPEAEAAWEAVASRLSEPRVRRARVTLSPPPEEFPAEPLEVCRSAPPAPSDEELEAEAVRAEACGWLPAEEGPS